MLSNSIIAVLSFFVWYYPVGLYRNSVSTDAVDIRAFHVVLLIWVTFLFVSSLAHLLIAGVDDEQVAASYATLLSIMLYAFCEILAGLYALPRFWIFVYCVNPFTYIVSSLMATTLGQAPASCAENEFQISTAPENQTCAQYMRAYIETVGDYLRDSQAAEQCFYCQMDSANQFLQGINASWETRWRDFGIDWVYVAFNTAVAIFIYWLCRVPKTKRSKKA